jgi:uncharacterized membrane protein YccC
MKGGLTFPTTSEWIFSLKTFVAAMAALYIALAAGLPRPYWAMATVYIVANPLTGMTRSKAAFRAAGTIIGASAAVFITPLLVNAPILFTLAISVWTGVVTFLALFDRTPRSYAFMLSGYTVPLIAFPALYAPASIFDTAVARTEEIILGIVCVAVINSIVFPASLTATVRKNTESLLADVRVWINSFSDESRDGEAMKQSQRLATDVAALDNLIVHLRYDVAAANMARHLKAFKERIARIPIVLHGLGDRLSVLRKSKAVDADLADLLADLALWFSADAQSEEQLRSNAGRIREKHGRLVAATALRRDWDGLILMNALNDIGDLIDIWRDCGVLREEITAGNLARRNVELLSSQAVERHWHHDVGALAITGASVALSGFIGSLIWLYSGWQAGMAFALMALIAGPFFGAMDNPLPPLKAMAIFMAASNLLASIFVFGILPGVSSYWGLVAVFALPFILFGTIMSRPQFALPGMLMTVGTASTVALTSSYSTDFVSFVDGSIASVGGVIFATVWSALTHSLGAALKARRIARMGWREMAAIARGRMIVSRTQYAGRGLDRLAQFVPRQPATVGTNLEGLDMMAELRVGAGLVHLRDQANRLPREQARTLSGIFDGVADWFETKLRTSRVDAPGPAILKDIDKAFVTFDTEPGHEPLLAALADLRRSLFPLAPIPQRDPDPQLAKAGSSTLAAE